MRDSNTSKRNRKVSTEYFSGSRISFWSMRPFYDFERRFPLSGCTLRESCFLERFRWYFFCVADHQLIMASEKCRMKQDLKPPKDADPDLKSFGRSSDNRHLGTHRTRLDQKLFKCSHCKKRFSHEVSLTRHIRTHTDVKPFQCTLCDQKFHQKANLTRHCRSHTGDKQFECPDCDQKFYQKTHLQDHSLIHSGEKPFECPSCSKKFRKDVHLVIHLRIHTGLQPYSCRFCRKKFSDKTNFIAHVRTHTGTKPFKCSVCRKGFTQSGTLRTHFRIHTGEKPFECGYCNHACNCRSNLRAHLRRVHAGEITVHGQAVVKARVPAEDGGRSLLTYKGLTMRPCSVRLRRLPMDLIPSRSVRSGKK